MAQLGDIFEKAGSYFAKIDTKERGVRYAMVGPPRCGTQAALQDLAAIRTGAAGAPTRSEGLQAMERIAKRLRDEAKVAMRGGIKTENADRMFARIKLTYDSLHHEINGPPRQAERRAKADLAKLRQAAQGHATMKESIAAMRQKSRELHQEAEFEANVAMGFAQYGLVRDAYKVVDSDPESDGPAPVDHDDSFEAADFSDPAVVKKFFPPPAPKPPRAPPRDAADATRQLADFMPTSETPEALRALLAARADPNLIIESARESQPMPILPEILSAMSDLGIEATQSGGTEDFTIMSRVIAFAIRPDHMTEMVDLLRQHGAKFEDTERCRYKKRYDALCFDPIYLRDFHRSAATFGHVDQCFKI